MLSATTKGYIFDLRTQQIAQTLKAKGGGTEVAAHYPQWKVVHKPVAKLSQLQEAFAKQVNYFCRELITSEPSR